MENPIDTIKRQLAQLKELQESGVMSQVQYDEGKTTLERRLLDMVLSGAALPAAAPAVEAADTTPASGRVTDSEERATATTAAPPARAKPSLNLMAMLSVLVVLVAGAGYLWKGTPVQPVVAMGDSAAQGDGAAHPTDNAQISAMVDKLAERLKAQPDDADGWSMLGRTYSVLGRHADALKAYQTAMNLRKDDATLVADYADSLAVNNNRTLDGEPMKYVERALKLEPTNLKALFLAGTHAFDKKDYAGAVKFWEKAAKSAPPENAFVQQIQPALAEARQLAGLPAAALPLDGATKQTAAAGKGSVSGTVTLASAMAKQANPDDTVFVFARPAEGSRMPLAILRKQVKDLPLQFTLDDSMAMSPANALSGASKVIVGARISRSGNAMPQPGDLTGQTATVNVGASGLQIEIKEAVKP
jgi:cytochrome c-type biogenesis protein CcmH